MSSVSGESTSKQQSSSLAASQSTLQEGDKEPIVLVKVLYPKSVKNCCLLLEFTIARSENDTQPREPLGQFTEDQITLAAQEFLYLIQNSRLSYIDIRDMMDNLYALHTRVTDLQPHLAITMGQSIKKLVQTMLEVSTYLEQISGEDLVNWSNFTTLIEKKTQGYIADKIKHFSEFIPQVSQLKEIKLLGAGGFGAVYKAIYTPAELICSVKLIPSDRFQYSKHAAVDKTVASIIASHFLVRYYSCFATSSAYVTLMEYIPGVDLNRVVDRVGILPIKTVRILIAQMYRAIEHLHFRGFLHRDIKVSNCLIMPGGRLKVIDFDTNKCCLGHFTNRLIRGYFRRTAFEFWDYETAGTFAYMAPEMLAGKPYGRAIDWWSLGITMYKMICGHIPFKSEKRSLLKNQIISQLHKWPDTNEKQKVTPEAKNFVDNLLKKDPKLRLGSRYYREFKKHKFFEGLDWIVLATKIDVCHLPMIAEAMCPSKPNARLDELTPEASEGSKQRAQIKIDQLKDLNKNEHLPSFTYASPGFRKLIIRAAVNKKAFKVTPSQVNTDMELTPEIDYAGKLEYTAFTSLSSTKLSDTASVTKSKHFTKLDTIDIVVNRNAVCCRNRFPFRYIQIPGQSATRKLLLVTHVSNGKSGLLYGDIIVSINCVKVTLLSNKQLRHVFAASKKQTTVQVLAKNPYRFLTDLKVDEHVGDLFKRKSIDFIIKRKAFLVPCCPLKQALGLVTDTRVLHQTNIDVKLGNFVHVVRLANKYCNITWPQNELLYTGDVISHIDGEDARKMDPIKFTNALKTNPLRITIVPSSPIRSIIS